MSSIGSCALSSGKWAIRILKGALQVVQHALAMLDLATAEPAGVGPIQTRRMAFQSVFLL
jgi:hypothetical protein